MIAPHGVVEWNPFVQKAGTHSLIAQLTFWPGTQLDLFEFAALLSDDACTAHACFHQGMCVSTATHVMSILLSSSFLKASVHRYSSASEMHMATWTYSLYVCVCLGHQTYLLSGKPCGPSCMPTFNALQVIPDNPCIKSNKYLTAHGVKPNRRFLWSQSEFFWSVRIRLKRHYSVGTIVLSFTLLWLLVCLGTYLGVHWFLQARRPVCMFVHDIIEIRTKRYGPCPSIFHMLCILCMLFVFHATARQYPNFLALALSGLCVQIWYSGPRKCIKPANSCAFLEFCRAQSVW